MTTTANGTTYTVNTATISGLGRVRWIIADAHTTDTNIPTVIYAHGANGGVGSFSGGSGWTGLRDWLIDHGWCVIEGEGGTTDSSGSAFNHWGNTMNRQAYRAYLDHVANLLDLGPLVPMGSSMGGLISKWLAMRSDISADCTGLISFAGVGTIFTGDYDTNPANNPTNINQRTGRYFSPSILNAYGVSTYEDLVTAAADHAPENWPAATWDGKRILEMYGTADVAVPWTPRGSGPLRTLRADRPAVDIAEEHVDATHDLATGVGMHLSVVTDFLAASIPPPPQTATILVAPEAYVVQAGNLYPIGFPPT